MATAVKFNSAEDDIRRITIYVLSMPVVDIVGEETNTVMVSQLKGPVENATAVFPVFHCPTHNLHSSVFNAKIEIIVEVRGSNVSIGTHWTDDDMCVYRWEELRTELTKEQALALAEALREAASL